MNALADPNDFLIPSRRTEDWKYSDLRRHLRAVPELAGALADAIQPGGPFRGIVAEEIVIANGRLNWWPERTIEGIEVTDAAGANDGAGPGTPTTAATMPLGALAAARTPDMMIVRVSGLEPRTLSLRLVSKAIGGAIYGRVGIVVDAGARLTLLEFCEGEGGDYFADHLLEIFVGERGSLDRICCLTESADVLSVTSASVSLARGARFNQTVLLSGAKLQRHETRVTHPGEGASVRLDGVYVLGGERHADLTTVVEHKGAGGDTKQLTKGVAAGKARGVFQGRIVVDHGADQTDARMGHHALILSDRAEIDAKPELEIYADDVACAHGNSIGTLDESALFYAMSRGLPEPDARAMLTQAFLGEVVDRIEREDVREVARDWLTQQLGALA